MPETTSYWTTLSTPIPIDEALQWTKIGAIGTLVGSLFSFIAIVISLAAFFYPRKVKIDAKLSVGFLISVPSIGEDIYTYTITVKNLGTKPITIKNIYLNFGGKNNEHVFVGMLNVGSPLQHFTLQFPQRLEQGESFEYHLLKDRLDQSLKAKVKLPLNTRLFIEVDEVTKGIRYIPTKLTLNSFIRENGSKVDD